MADGVLDVPNWKLVIGNYNFHLATDSSLPPDKLTNRANARVDLLLADC